MRVEDHIGVERDFIRLFPVSKLAGFQVNYTRSRRPVGMDLSPTQTLDRPSAARSGPVSGPLQFWLAIHYSLPMQLLSFLPPHRRYVQRLGVASERHS